MEINLKPGKLITVKSQSIAEYTEKKSRFICNIKPVKNETEAESFISEIKQKHPDARHNIFAYIAGRFVKCSDDGEPQGSAGVPVLDVLRKNGVDMTVAVVTRYFGGILLGAGGLVRAYSKAASSALAAAGIQEYIKYIECKALLSYTELQRFKYELGKYHTYTDKIEYSDKVAVNFAVIAEEYDSVNSMIISITGGNSTVQAIGSRFDI